MCKQSCKEWKKSMHFMGNHGQCFENRTITVFQKIISCVNLHTEEAEEDLCRCRPALKLLSAWSNWIFNQSFLELKTAVPHVLLMVPGLWCTTGRCFSIQNQFLSLKYKALLLFEQGASGLMRQISRVENHYTNFWILPVIYSNMRCWASTFFSCPWLGID